MYVAEAISEEPTVADGAGVAETAFSRRHDAAKEALNVAESMLTVDGRRKGERTICDIMSARSSRSAVVSSVPIVIGSPQCSWFPKRLLVVRREAVDAGQV